jgi:hypothetical protein
MAHALKTQQGRRAQYGRRQCTVEPLFGIIKQIMGFRQFSVRGLAATPSEWKRVARAYKSETVAHAGVWMTRDDRQIPPDYVVA